MTALYEAIARVMAKIGYVQKTGQVSGGQIRYRFASEVDLLRALRPVMVEEGLILLPVRVEPTTTTATATKSGSRGDYTVTTHTTRTVATYRLAHVSGEHVDLQIAGEGSDSGDKSVPKSMTIALKYALRQAFLIETGDDPDEQASQEQEEQPAAQRPAPQPASPEENEVRALLRQVGATSRRHADAACRAVTEHGSVLVETWAQATGDATAMHAVLVGLHKMISELGPTGVLPAVAGYMDKE